MRRKKPLVLIDTNIFISGLILPSSKPGRIIEFWKFDLIDVVLSQYLYDEIIEVISRDKIKNKYNISKNDILKLDILLKNESKLVRLPKKNITKIVVRDKKDQIVLETALAGKADFLVSGDDDLLILRNSKKLGTLKIVNMGLVNFRAGFASIF